MAGPWSYVRALLMDPVGQIIVILYVGLSVFVADPGQCAL
ncbi:hypothetical protein J2750_000863 [Methanococcoides alaskense]|uniref:Uncharacterized protein n=1 Tax=Methanococcoides alaskense TaxID=325778 RepID=A0AA90TZ66_9EURY|nr:hypothetical protein [Methanococcoides alaskense]